MALKAWTGSWNRLDDPVTRRWISIVTLSTAAGLLLLVLIWTWSAALNPSGARCSNAPARVTSISQTVAVSVCLLAFLLGRITARPRIRSRSHLKDWTAGAAATRPPHESRARAAVWTQSALTAALFLMAFLFTFEAITLASSVWPITYYLRCANQAAPVRTLVAASAFCFLAGRWLWLPTTPRSEH